MNRFFRLSTGILTLIVSFAFCTFSSAESKNTGRVRKRYAPALEKQANKKSSLQERSTIKAPKEEKKVSPSLAFWLEKMKKRVETSYAKHNQIVAVGAVRGAEAPSAPPLYWKGKKSNGPMNMDELQQFDEAVSFALNGDDETAIKKYEQFLIVHPESDLRDDAIHTLGLLKEKN